MTLTNEQVAKELYSICQIYGASCARLVGEDFRCGFDNNNKSLLNALILTCEKRDLTYRFVVGKWATTFELTW